LAATYSRATSDSTAFSTSIASLAYNHKYDAKKNTFGAEANYAARRSGVGIQGGVNYSRIFSYFVCKCWLACYLDLDFSLNLLYGHI
jgi:hypothetical protein